MIKLYCKTNCNLCPYTTIRYSNNQQLIFVSKEVEDTIRYGGYPFGMGRNDLESELARKLCQYVLYRLAQWTGNVQNESRKRKKQKVKYSLAKMVLVILAYLHLILY